MCLCLCLYVDCICAWCVGVAYGVGLEGYQIAVIVICVVIAAVAILLVWRAVARRRQAWSVRKLTRMTKREDAIRRESMLRAPLPTHVPPLLGADEGLIAFYRRMNIRSVDDLAARFEADHTGQTDVDGEDGDPGMCVPPDVLTCAYYHGTIGANDAYERLHLAWEAQPNPAASVFLLRWAPGLMLCIVDGDGWREHTVRWAMNVWCCLMV